MSLEIYLEIIFSIVALVAISFYFINHKHNVNNTLRVAARMLNTKVKNSLINGSYVIGYYKEREIVFSTVVQPPRGVSNIMIQGWMINRVIQISTIANVQPCNISVTRPTDNIYMDGNKVIYKFPEQKSNFIGIKSGQSYPDEDLPKIMDELVLAAAIVEKQQKI